MAQDAAPADYEISPPFRLSRLKLLWMKPAAITVFFGVLRKHPLQHIPSCVLVIVPNLTRGNRPYALIENVVTHARCRKRGHASALLARAREIACDAGCYKIMLMTGSKQESTLRFYERAGYNKDDKTAFIMWL